jgi:hypothetical protein
MSYQYLGQDLHETADKAKKYFKDNYGAKSFLCEQEIVKDLGLRPTWQAQQSDGYLIALNVQPQPFSPTLHEFVNKCAKDAMPLKLWVVVPRRPANTTFNQDLRNAHEMGVGVIDFPDVGAPHIFHRPVPISLFALGKIDPKTFPAIYRPSIKAAEDTFLDGDPGQGCQTICQELEDLTRKCASVSYQRGWFQGGWAPPSGQAFFDTGSWANLLREFENRIDIASIRGTCPLFDKQLIVIARGHTDWRNSVSHKPKNLKELKKRDPKLRTMFETTRNLLIDWANATKPLKLK